MRRERRRGKKSRKKRGDWTPHNPALIHENTSENVLSLATAFHFRQENMFCFDRPEYPLDESTFHQMRIGQLALKCPRCGAKLQTFYGLVRHFQMNNCSEDDLLPDGVAYQKVRDIKDEGLVAPAEPAGKRYQGPKYSCLSINCPEIGRLWNNFRYFCKVL